MARREEELSEEVCVGEDQEEEEEEEEEEELDTPPSCEYCCACVRVCVYVCDFLGFVCVCVLVSLSGVSVTCQTVYLPLMCVFVRASARVKKYQSR